MQCSEALLNGSGKPDRTRFAADFGLSVGGAVLRQGLGQDLVHVTYEGKPVARCSIKVLKSALGRAGIWSCGMRTLRRITCKAPRAGSGARFWHTKKARNECGQCKTLNSLVAEDGIEPPTRGFSRHSYKSEKLFLISHLRRLPSSRTTVER